MKAVKKIQCRRSVTASPFLLLLNAKFSAKRKGVCFVTLLSVYQTCRITRRWGVLLRLSPFFLHLYCLHTVVCK